MFADKAGINDLVNVTMVHVDVLGWGSAEDDLYQGVQREIEGYVIDACSYGLSRSEIELDLQQIFKGRLDRLEFHLVTTHAGDVKAVISADAFDRV